MAGQITQQWQLGPGRVTVAANAAQTDLLPRVQRTLRQHYERTGALTVGDRIRFGWSELILVQQTDGVLQLGEPDFDGDPAQGIVPGICQTLEIYSEQRAFAEFTGVSPVWTAYDDHVLMETGCLTAQAFQLQRFEPEVWMPDSGWSVSVLGAEAGRKVQHELLQAWQLVHCLPACRPLMALPEHYGAVLDGETVKLIVPA
ncbi:hypothetical protein [Leeia sp.]|uniref:hypothetical protein n=1 Tax=Leeia sp. TaxID=2884678 RepID=UPI0035AFBE8E